MPKVTPAESNAAWAEVSAFIQRSALGDAGRVAFVTKAHDFLFALAISGGKIGRPPERETIPVKLALPDYSNDHVPPDRALAALVEFAREYEVGTEDLWAAFNAFALVIAYDVATSPEPRIRSREEAGLLWELATRRKPWLGR